LQEALTEALESATDEALELGLKVAWDVHNAEASKLAREYTYDLVTQINDSTKKQLGEALGRWIDGDEEFTELVERIRKIVPDNPYPFIKDRAETIAVTEVTRVYADARWASLKASGSQFARWKTSEDALVCEICQPLGAANGGLGARGSVATGIFIHPETGAQVMLPAHVNCRCHQVADPIELEQAVGIFREPKEPGA